MTIREGVVFGLMTEEERKALYEANGRCLPIECVGKDGWQSVYDPHWFAGTAYRIAPTPVEPFRVDPIVWQVLDPKWRWITAGKTVVVWQSQPNTDIGFWNASRGMKLDGFIAPGLIQRGTCPWQEAIAERPEGM